jgi:hypothetical protein
VVYWGVKKPHPIKISFCLHIERLKLMNKKGKISLKILDEQDLKPGRRKSLTNSLSRSASMVRGGLKEEGHNSGIEGVHGAASNFIGKSFNSPSEALNALVESVVKRFDDDSEEQDEMREFLYALLESDPELAEEILAGIEIQDS